MSVKELYLLPVGDVGQIPPFLPVYSVLVKTDEGNILFDTGFNPEGIAEPERVFGDFAPILKLKPEDDIRKRIRQVGATEDEVQFIVQSHFHIDHVGGLRFFTKSTIFIQEKEYRYALASNDAPTAASRKDWDIPLNYRVISGDTRIVPGVWAISAPGHSVGTQAMVVKLEKSGFFVFAGDTIFTYQDIANGIPSSVYFDESQALESMRRLVNLSDMLNGTILVGHDPIFWKKFKPLYPYR